jgi:hypothetical protein
MAPSEMKTKKRQISNGKTWNENSTVFAQYDSSICKLIKYEVEA